MSPIPPCSPAATPVSLTRADAATTAAAHPTVASQGSQGPPPLPLVASPSPAGGRSVFRRPAALGLAAGVLLAGLAVVVLMRGTWGSPLRRCQTYAPPADRVAYEEDPAEAKRLLAAGGYVAHPFKGELNFWDWTGKPLGPVEQKVPPLDELTRQPAGVVFLHDLSTPKGVTRLVVVQPHFAGNYGRHEGGVQHVVQLRAYLVTAEGNLPPTRRMSGRLGLSFEGTATVRLFAGQADASDRSRFTIAYEADGRRGVIEGQLGDDLVVGMLIRSGPAVGQPLSPSI